jgi:ATP-dependent protease ClpP protease subunit
MNLIELYKNDMNARGDIINSGCFLSEINGNLLLTLYLTKAIKGPSEYIYFAQMASELGENDMIELILATPGGELDGANIINTSVNNSPAQSVAYLTGEVCSAGTIIALNCDQMEVTDEAEFMIHPPSYGSYGTHHEVDAHVTFSTKQQKALMRTAYKDFLSEKEIKKLIKGKNMWFTAEETRERWKKVLAVREKESDLLMVDAIADSITQYQGTIKNLEEQLSDIQKKYES